MQVSTVVPLRPYAYAETASYEECRDTARFALDDSLRLDWAKGKNHYSRQADNDILSH
jgi:hypothetical protein